MEGNPQTSVEQSAGGAIRLAAAGDIHVREGTEDRVRQSFEELRDRSDLVLLAGDLTTCGKPEEAAVLAHACRDLGVPVIAVLGNHDWHQDRADEISAVLAEAGITVLDRDCAIREVGGSESASSAPRASSADSPAHICPTSGSPR